MEQWNNRTIGQSGYVALASVLVIAVVVLVIGVSTSLLSVNEAQRSLAGFRNETVVDFVESCAEDTLLYFNENGSLPAQIVLPEGTCDIVDSSTVDTTSTFTVVGEKDNHTKRIRIIVERDTTITVTAWEEIE